MVKFFERLFRKKETGPMLFSYVDLPVYLNEKEDSVRTLLVKKSESSGPIVEEALEELRIQVHALEGIEPDEEATIHPKLRRVVEHAIPSFISAMDIILDREVSTVPEEFYSNMVDVVNGFGKNMRGQGKYITAVFPGAMKDIRRTIDRIGHELNAMTKEMKPALATISDLSEIRAVYESIDRNVQEYRETEKNTEKLRSEISDGQRGLESLNEEISAIKAGDEYLVAIDAEGRIKTHEAEKTAIANEYSRLVSTSSNLFRKTEYNADKANNKTLARKIRDFRNMLENPGPDAVDAMVSAYSAIYPELNGMILANDSLIKNKSEERLFSEENVMTGALSDICGRYLSVSTHLQESRATVAGSAALKQKEECEKRKKNIQMKIDDIDGSVESSVSVLEELRQSIPPLLDSLNEKLSAFEGREVEIRTEGADLLSD